MDGEGTFGLYAPSQRGTRATTRQPVVQAVQCHQAPLHRLALMFGGKVKEHTVTAKGTQMYIWRITSAPMMVDAIEKMLPYLTIKQPAAQLVMEYAKTVLPRGSSRYAHSDEVLVQRSEIITNFDSIRMHKVA